MGLDSFLRVAQTFLEYPDNTLLLQFVVVFFLCNILRTSPMSQAAGRRGVLSAACFQRARTVPFARPFAVGDGARLLGFLRRNSVRAFMAPSFLLFPFIWSLFPL